MSFCNEAMSRNHCVTLISPLVLRSLRCHLSYMGASLCMCRKKGLRWCFWGFGDVEGNSVLKPSVGLDCFAVGVSAWCRVIWVICPDPPFLVVCKILYAPKSETWICGENNVSPPAFHLHVVFSSTVSGTCRFYLEVQMSPQWGRGVVDPDWMEPNLWEKEGVRDRQWFLV